MCKSSACAVENEWPRVEAMSGGAGWTVCGEMAAGRDGVRRGGRGGLGSAQGSVTWVWTGFGQLLLHSWVGGGGEDGLSFSAVPAAASHMEQDLTSLPAHRRQTHSGHLNRPMLALLASLHFPFQKTGNIREQTHISLLICSGQ